MKKEKYTEGMTLRIKVGINLACFSFILILLISLASYNLIRKQFLVFYTDEVSSDAICAADLIDGDLALEALADGAYSQELLKQLDKLDTIKGANHLKYLYLFTIDGKGITYIYTALAPTDSESDAVPIGTFESFEEGDEIMRSVVDGKKATSSLDISGGRWGYVASAFAPVFDKNGEVVALIGADYDMYAILNGIKSLVILAALFVSLIVLLFLAGVLIYMDYNIIAPIKLLTKRASELVSSNDKDTELVIEDVVLKNKDEIGTLGFTFNEMAHNIERYVREIQDVTAEKEHIETELSVARKIQAMFLPRLEPPFTTMAGKRFEIYASMEPAKAVGGDFYDFYMIDNDHLGITIADVSGKGVPAALFMAISKTILKNQMLSGKSPAEALMESNKQLSENNDENMFVTVFLGILELNTGVFTFGNAGHNLPLIYSADKASYEWLLMKPNFVLAAMPGVKYGENSVTLKHGDSLLLYTDGVTEAMNEESILYGDEGLLDFANVQLSAAEEALSSKTDRLKESLNTFRGNAQQSDDITILMLRYGV